MQKIKKTYKNSDNKWEKIPKILIILKLEGI